MNTTARKLRLSFRWILRRHLKEVLDIEDDVFEFPWREADFVRCLRQHSCIGIVAEHDDRVVGYVIYELHRDRIYVMNIAVAREFWRRGVGSALIEHLVGKLHCHRLRIVLETRDSNLLSHLFFKRAGFKCVGVLQDFYDDTADDAYVFQYRKESRV